MATQLNDCGCCEGIASDIPAGLTNRPGLSQVSYRIGRQPDFLQSALAALSDANFPALRGLTTRDPDDFTIALLDAWATLADVFTFYQERIANECWLRTATERDSIVRLAQLIGYRLPPGVAAQTSLAFLLDETPGAPDEVALDVGAKVQSVPGASETAQTFETIEALDARVEWNTLQPALTIPPAIAAGLTNLYLQSAATNLNPGDVILIVGDERLHDPASERWDVRVLLKVVPDAKNNRTLVTWEKVLGEGSVLPAAENVKIFALRQRAAQFGHNAPDPKYVTQPGGTAVGSWPGFDTISNPIDLDAAYPKIVAGSWLALVDATGYVELYNATTVRFPSVAAFGLSGKVTRVTLDGTENLTLFDRRGTIVYAQSEELKMAPTPLLAPSSGWPSYDPDLLAPVEDSVIQLDRLIPPLAVGRKIIVTGKLLRARATAALKIVSADGLQSANVSVGDSLTIIAPPSLLTGNLAQWSLRTDEDFVGNTTTGLDDLILTAAINGDATVSEMATVQQCAGDPTELTLSSGLTNLFDRSTVTIAANVATATQGETVTEVLGSGNAGQPNQSFKLKQPPLTYVPASVPGGAESTLQIRVNNLLWHEAQTLFATGPRDRIFATEMADDASVTVRLGDGISGARLPSGSQNIGATYRRGIGLAGLVRANQLTTLLTRPPGLKSVTNPLPAEGAADPETFANAQENAPITVLTLDRVVSLSDYENFARNYAGFAKALATWTWDGRTRGVFLSVAGPNGAAISDTLAQQLIDAIHESGDPFVPVRVASYDESLFKLSAQILVDGDYESDAVFSAINDALRANFSFAARAFGDPVEMSEVIAVIQSVAGIVAVNLKTLYRTGAPAILNARLEASLPNGGDPDSLGAAELLTLDPAPIYLEVMP